MVQSTLISLQKSLECGFSFVNYFRQGLCPNIKKNHPEFASKLCCFNTILLPWEQGIITAPFLTIPKNYRKTTQFDNDIAAQKAIEAYLQVFGASTRASPQIQLYRTLDPVQDAAIGRLVTDPKYNRFPVVVEDPIANSTSGVVVEEDVTKILAYQSYWKPMNDYNDPRFKKIMAMALSSTYSPTQSHCQEGEILEGQTYEQFMSRPMVEAKPFVLEGEIIAKPMCFLVHDKDPCPFHRTLVQGHVKSFQDLLQRRVQAPMVQGLT